MLLVSNINLVHTCAVRRWRFTRAQGLSKTSTIFFLGRIVVSSANIRGRELKGVEMDKWACGWTLGWVSSRNKQSASASWWFCRSIGCERCDLSKWNQPVYPLCFRHDVDVPLRIKVMIICKVCRAADGLRATMQIERVRFCHLNSAAWHTGYRLSASWALYSIDHGSLSRYHPKWSDKSCISLLEYRILSFERWLCAEQVSSG